MYVHCQELYNLLLDLFEQCGIFWFFILFVLASLFFMFRNLVQINVILYICMLFLDLGYLNHLTYFSSFC